MLAALAFELITKECVFKDTEPSPFTNFKKCWVRAGFCLKMHGKGFSETLVVPRPKVRND